VPLSVSTAQPVSVLIPARACRYTQRIQTLEQELQERGASAADGVQSAVGGGAGGGGGVGSVPVPEVIAEDELVVIRHRLQGELNSIDGR